MHRLHRQSKQVWIPDALRVAAYLCVRYRGTTSGDEGDDVLNFQGHLVTKLVWVSIFFFIFFFVDSEKFTKNSLFFIRYYYFVQNNNNNETSNYKLTKG